MAEAGEPEDTLQRGQQQLAPASQPTPVARAAYLGIKKEEKEGRREERKEGG